MFKSALVGVTAFALATVAITGQSPNPGPSRSPAQLDTLAGVFSGPRAAVRDTNGDGLNDAVAARVIVPDTPTADDVEAAANIAARLGYETTALTMPLVVRDSEVTAAPDIGLPILVGRQNRYVQALVKRGAIDLESLQPGQGVIALVPSPFGDPSGIVVAGGDDAGTLAAGVELGARLPRLWNMTGVTLGGIEQQVASFLASHGVAGATVRVTRLVVDAERRGIRSIGVRAAVAPGLVARAAAALNELDAEHRRGQGERTIDFAEAAATTVEIVAPSLPRRSPAESATACVFAAGQARGCRRRHRLKPHPSRRQRDSTRVFRYAIMALVRKWRNWQTRQT